MKLLKKQVDKAENHIHFNNTFTVKKGALCPQKNYMFFIMFLTSDSNI